MTISLLIYVLLGFIVASLLAFALTFFDILDFAEGEDELGSFGMMCLVALVVSTWPFVLVACAVIGLAFGLRYLIIMFPVRWAAILRHKMLAKKAK